MKYVIDIEMSLTQEELEDLSKLSSEWGKEFGDTARECMMTYCRDTLETFEKNVPTPTTSSEGNVSSTNPFEGLDGGVTISDEDDCLGCQ